MGPRRLLGRVFFTMTVAVAVACGGATSDPLFDPMASSSSGGSSSGSSGSRTTGCEAVDCAQCATGTRPLPAIPGQCCRCEPIPNQCAGIADDCSNKKGCGAGYERFEYAPGCCDCRLSACSTTTCRPFNGCPSGQHVDLGGCCPTCVADSTCKTGAVPCSSFVCPPGYKGYGSETVDGAGCCSSCEADPAFCLSERQTFSTWLGARLAQPDALDCQTKDDCEIVNLSNACQPSCGTGVAKGQGEKIMKEVMTYASAHCANCPALGISCPAVVLTPRCGPDKKCTTGP